MVSFLKGFYDNDPLNRELIDFIQIARAESTKRLTLEIRSCLTYSKREDTPADQALSAKEKADKMKKQLPSFMTNVLCEHGKCRSNIVRFLPFIGFDVDHITSERVAQLISVLKDNQHVVLAEPSVSGRGVHFMIMVDTADWLNEKWNGKDIKPYEFVYQQVREYVERTFSVDVDSKCSNPEHVFGICYDDNIHYNDNPVPLHVDTSGYIVQHPKSMNSNIGAVSGSYRASLYDVSNLAIKKVEDSGVYFTRGHRNDFILRYASWCNKFGVDQCDVESYCMIDFVEPDFTETEIKATIRSAYSHTNEFGTFCAVCADAQPCAKDNEKYNSLIISNINNLDNSAHDCANAQTAQKSDDDELSIDFHHTFSDKIDVEDWPEYLKPVIDSMDDAESKDKMILATIVINSGMIPNLYGIYSNKIVFSPMYIIFYGPSASRKGEIGSCINIIKPLKNEIVGDYQKEHADYLEAHSVWESKGGKAADKAERGPEPKEPDYRSPIIPANSSASAAYLALHANHDWGIMFETEASTLTRSLLSDYGNYTDGLLAAFHHEPIKMNRTKDKVRFDIDQPRLAIGLTCTPGQLPKLFPTFEDGLGNRFLFYGLNRKLQWLDPFKKVEKPLDEVYEDLGKLSLDIYHQMTALGDRRIQFVLSESQQAKFNVFFSDMLMEQFSILGDGISSFIFRLGLSTFRTAMVLTILRRYSEWDKEKPFFEETEQAIVCLDKDIDIAITIMNTLVSHTAAIYAVLAKDDEGLCNIELSRLSSAERSLFNALNEDFSTADVKAIAESLHLNPATVRRYISKYVNIVHIAERVKNGWYRKVHGNKDTSNS